MMPFCDHQNWLQRLLHRRCWRVARHLHHCSDDWFDVNACDKHWDWQIKKIKEHEHVAKNQFIS